MNYLAIKEPRWHDNTVLLASWKIGESNQIKINHHDYPHPYYISGEQIKQYPTTEVKTKAGSNAVMYVIPIKDLSTDLEIEEL